MPALPRRQSFELLQKMHGHHEPGLMGSARPPKASSTRTSTRSSVGGIDYIPSQQDPMASSSRAAARQSPSRLIFEDTGVLLRSLRFLPYVLLPFWTNDPNNELFLNPAGIQFLTLQSLLFIMESLLLVLAVPAILVLPGLVSLAGIALSFLAIWLITKPFQGSSVSYSKMNEDVQASAEQHKDERWFFVNGCAVGHLILQKNIDRLAATFGRAVIGIHNMTYGLWGDLIECLVQRCLGYCNNDVRVAYYHIKAALIDPTVSKVVLIGHSQGGIIVSLVIDELFTELPVSCMSKLEIYTFGSAASHFSNPLVSSTSQNRNTLPPSPTKVHFDTPPQPKHVIPYIEHYANEWDMVPRWGVLYCIQGVLDNRYAGSVFVRMGASGHMFNQHYMDPMFLLIGEEAQSPTDGFLDTMVKVEETLAIQREDSAVSCMGLMKRQSGLEFGDGQIIHGQPSPTDDTATDGINGTEDEFMTFARTSSGRLMAEQAQGKTVRELSRLWRYQGGRSPHTPSPFPTLSSNDQSTNGMNGTSGTLDEASPLSDGGRELSSPESIRPGESP